MVRYKRSTNLDGMLNCSRPYFRTGENNMLFGSILLLIMVALSHRGQVISMASLQDQLLKVGIVDIDKAKKINKEKRKKARQTPKGKVALDEAKEQAKQTLAEKSESDRARSKALQIAADRKAIHAQVIQLVKTNTIDRSSGETTYQFTDDMKIKKIYVSVQQQNELIRGQLAIAKLEEEYTLIPRQIAEKIQQREDHIITVLNSQQQSELDADDPYADYQIPDDLMW